MRKNEGRKEKEDSNIEEKKAFGTLSSLMFALAYFAVLYPVIFQKRS